MGCIRRFMQEESGVTAAEYGIILGCIAAVLVSGMFLFYQGMGDLFSRYGEWFAGGTPP